MVQPHLSAVKPNPWRERAAWMLALALLCALAFFAAGHDRAPSASEPVRFSVNPPEKTVFSGPPNLTVPVPQFALSPDGRAMVFVANSSGADPVIWMRSIDQVTARPLPGTEHAQSPFWSPDSRWLGFFAEGKLKKIPVAGGPVQVLADVADAFGGSWGADGSIIFGKTKQRHFSGLLRGRNRHRGNEDGYDHESAPLAAVPPRRPSLSVPCPGWRPRTSWHLCRLS